MDNQKLLGIIWDNIRGEADAIRGYHDMLSEPFTQSEEGTPLKTLIELIISDERDHLAALNVAYEALNKAKPAVDAVELIRTALVDQKESRRLIK